MNTHLTNCNFLQVFPCCESLSGFCGGLEKATLSTITLDVQKLELCLQGTFPRLPVEQERLALLQLISKEYGLLGVDLQVNAAPEMLVRSALVPAMPQQKAMPGALPGAMPGAMPGALPGTILPKRPRVPLGSAHADVLMGRPVRGESMPVKGLTLESGLVTVRGRVFDVQSREITKTGAGVLSFALTDGTDSVRISKYLRPEHKEMEIIHKVKSEQFLAVCGKVEFNRYEDELTIDAKNIQVCEAPKPRQDTAPEKRVELHMHTRYSNLDALGDPAAIIQRAAKWGHPAVAITDHGVAQAFPEAWHAAEKAGIKVIYGIEGYYVNDVDDKLAIHGVTDLPLEADFVAVDLECTGLYADRDRITEIGAVRFSKGQEVDRFQSFVNPHMPISEEITKLTGITNEDVADAPDEAEALAAFLAFAGDAPLVAHNAMFDIGFLTASARRCELPFAPVYIDTLVLSQSLYPHLKNFKLDVVSNYLGLPEFEHHRASDDAEACGRIFARMYPQLQEQGVHTLQDLSSLLHQDTVSVVRTQHSRHIILLVKNKTGLKNLYKIISASYLQYFHRNPVMPKSLIEQYREGLIIGSACEAGEIFQAMLRQASDEELCRLGAFYDYLEIQPVCNNQFLIDNGTAKDIEQLRDYNRRIVHIADLLGKPTVATGDVHFLDPGDEVFRRILLATKKYKDSDRDLPIYFKTTDEMLEEFAYLGEETCRAVVIDNPRSIADSVEEIQLLPKGQLFAPKIENSAGQLKDLVYGRMTELYGENPPALVRERVETELNTILEHEYDVIYMSAQKLVQNSLENGYLVGSRGSVGSSIVAYLSGITEVNSLPPHYRCKKCKYTDFDSGKGYGCGADMPDQTCPVCGEKLFKDGFDIPFETFLGFPGNEKTPDIDLNFSGEYQARAHKYTEELFGSDHVFRAGTIGTVAEKTAFGYVRKYLEEHDMQVSKAEHMRLALGCVGVKRTTGQHPGGLVVIPQDMDVTDFCPVQHPADDPDSGIITTHFEYHCMEDNLLKLDELGHDDPTMIRMLEDLTGVNAREIPLDDPKTMRIFCSPEPLGLPDDDPIIGKTGSIGIPEFGTSFTRQMLVDTQPRAFDILVRLSGFSHGTDVWLGNAKDLITSGTATVNQTVGCRDDIMLYLIEKGMEPKMAFKIMEAVRKGKVKKNGFSEGWEEKMHELDVPQWYIDSLAKIAYLFPKAHAVAYVMMAFRIAWFKVHEPLAFYSAYFYRRSQKGNFDAALMTQGIQKVRAKLQEISENPDPSPKDEDLVPTLESVYEFYKRGFSFAPLDIYESDAFKFLPVGDKQLRAPFNSISGLGENAAMDLAACKQKGVRFVSIEEVRDACPKVSQNHMEMLQSLGAMGDLPETNQISLF